MKDLTQAVDYINIITKLHNFTTYKTDLPAQSKDEVVGLKNLLGQQKPDEYAQEILEVITQCDKKEIFTLAYRQAIYDVRMQIATHLVDLDPNGTREKWCKKVDNLIMETKFEGFPK